MPLLFTRGLPDEKSRNLVNTVPRINRVRRRSLGWTPSPKQLIWGKVLDWISLVLGSVYLVFGVFALFDLGGMGSAMGGPSFFALMSSVLLFGFSDMLSGGRSVISCWMLLLVAPISGILILASIT